MYNRKKLFPLQLEPQFKKNPPFPKWEEKDDVKRSKVNADPEEVGGMLKSQDTVTFQDPRSVQ